MNVEVVWPSSRAVTAERHAEDCGSHVRLVESYDTVSGNGLEKKGSGAAAPVSDRIPFGFVRGAPLLPSPSSLFRPSQSSSRLLFGNLSPVGSA